MKKVLVIILSLLFALSCLLLAACDTTVTSLEFENAPEQVVRGSTIDYSSIYVAATFEDGTTKTLPLTDKHVTHTNVDTSTIGQKKLTARYGGKSAETIITVVAEEISTDHVIVTEFNNTDGYNAYLAAKEEQSNKQTEFYNRDEIYKVGNVNGYKFVPVITVLDEDLEEVSLSESQIKTNYTLYTKESNGSYTKVADNSVYLNNVEHNVYYFNSNAVGVTFKLEVSLAEGFEYIDDDMETTVEQEFVVVEGYNVYDALSLSVLDNLNTESWKSLKSHKNDWDNGKALSEFTNVKQVILHNNITLTADFLPDNYFWQKGANATEEGSQSYNDAYGKTPEHLQSYFQGSLREVNLGEAWEGDSVKIQRALFVSDGIGLSGNYLTIGYDPNYNTDGNNGLYVACGWNTNSSTSYPEAHWSIIKYFQPSSDNPAPNSATIENVYFIGEMGKDVDVNLPTGLMMMSSNITEVTVDNTIAADWYGNFVVDGEVYGTLNVSGCKMYSSFRQMIFSRRMKEINITNSELKGAGGPLMIIHTRTGSADDSVTNTNVNVDSVTNLESLVTGSEPWFEICLPGKSSVISQLLTIASMPNPNYYKKVEATVNGEEVELTQANLIAVVIPDPGDVFDNTHAIQGTINVGTHSYSMLDGVFNAMLNLSSTASTAVTVAQNTIDAMTQLGQDTSSLQKLKAGFVTMTTAAAKLKVAPVYKCGNVYGMFNGTKFESLSEEVKTEDFDSLYGGVRQVITQLTALVAGSEGQQQATAQTLLTSWQAIELALRPLGTLDIPEDWSTSWNAKYITAWINPGGLDAAHPDISIKHFMVFLGENNSTAS